MNYEKKPSYKDVLRSKLADLFLSYHVEMSDDCFEELFQLTSEECRRSFTNGLAAGKSRADRTTSRPWRPVKGGALQSGRLRPVENGHERELIVEELDGDGRA